MSRFRKTLARKYRDQGTRSIAGLELYAWVRNAAIITRTGRVLRPRRWRLL